MAKSNFKASMDFVFSFEGGYVNVPQDTGGPTNMGVTQAVLSAWRGKPVTAAEVKKLKKEEAKEIFKARYWDPLRCDEMPAGVDLVIFDFGVNSGIARSAKFSQQILQVIADGKIGPVTLAALAKYPPDKFINELCDRRQAFLDAIVASRPNQRIFLKGWTRRVKEVRATALDML